GPYAALGVGLALFAPVVWWNARHGWVSFLFQGGRAVGSPTFRPLSLLGAIAGQAVYLYPWIWMLVVAALLKRIGEAWHRSASRADLFLLGQSAVPLVVFLGVACFRPVLPHWALVASLSAFPFLGSEWADWAVQSWPRTRRWGIAMGMASLLLAGTAA